MSRAVGEVLHIVIGVVIALVMSYAFLMRGLLVPCRVTSESMEPNVHIGQRIVVDRTAFWFRAPQRWDIVVLICPEQPRELCVKRVAGLPGERVQIRDGIVHANGQACAPPIDVLYGPRSGRELGDSPEYILGAGEYFVLGDNSLVSEDSRSWEPPAVKVERIVGRPIGIRRSGQETTVRGQ